MGKGRFCATGVLTRKLICNRIYYIVRGMYYVLQCYDVYLMSHGLQVYCQCADCPYILCVSLPAVPCRHLFVGLKCYDVCDVTGVSGLLSVLGLSIYAMCLLMVPCHHMGYFLPGVHGQCSYYHAHYFTRWRELIRLRLLLMSWTNMRPRPSDERQRVSVYVSLIDYWLYYTTYVLCIDIGNYKCGVPGVISSSNISCAVY